MDLKLNKNINQNEEERETIRVREEEEISDIGDMSGVSSCGEDANMGQQAPRTNDKEREEAEKGPGVEIASRFFLGGTKKRAHQAAPGETSDPAVATKVSTATRGGHRRPIGAHRFLKEAKDALTELAISSGSEEDDPPYRQPSKSAAQRGPRKTKEVTPTESGNPSAATTEALAAQAIAGVARIQGQVAKSSNLKGTTRGEINAATQAVIDAVEGLRTITPSEEQRRLRADNARLAQELELVRAELRAFKEAYSEAQKKSAAPKPAAESTTGLEELKRELLQMVGGMVNARLEDLETRLPPEPVLRPPLRADKRQAPPPRPKAQSGLLAGAIEGEVRPAQAPPAETNAAGPKKNKNRKKKQGKGPKTADPPPPPPQSKGGRSPPNKKAGQKEPAPQPQANDETPWSKVVGRKARGKTSAKPRPAPSPQTGAGQKKKGAPSPKPKIVVPRTAAIVVSLKPGADITMAGVLTKAKTSIRLPDYGLTTVKLKTSVTGAKLMEVGGETPEETADRLAAKLTEVVGAWANIARPTKTAAIRVTGLDDTVTREELAASVAAAGGCSPEAIKVGQIRLSFWGGGSAVLQCPATAAKAAVQKGKVAIGWTMATIKAMEARPLRCFRCMRLGHTSALCPQGSPTEADLGKLCFRCGNGGHKAATCEAPAKCAVCAKAGRPHRHVMGGAKCAPPSVKGKAPRGKPSQPPPDRLVDEGLDMEVSQ